MRKDRVIVVEDILRSVAKLIATSPAGHKLRVIGGFRHRLLNNSCRTSLDLDLDYHWDDQIDAAVAANLKAAGGGGMVFDAVMAALKSKLWAGGEAVS